jgi:protein-disulfide isomerase
MKYKIFAGTCIVLVAIFAGTAFYYKSQEAKKLNFLAQNNAAIFIRDHSATLGSSDAKVFLVEFMDPACETCAAFSPLVKQIMAANPGKIKLVLRYAPFHEGADYFVKILEASKKQDKYWETLDVMFKSQSKWTSGHKALPEKVWPILTIAGLDIEKLKKDMNDPAINKVIEQDLADAKTLNVRKTPGYFVNGVSLVSKGFGRQQLYDLIQSEINAQY